MTPVGVFTVETKRYKGKIEVRSRRSQLWINGRNRSNLLQQARRQAAAVDRALERAGLAEVSVTPVLCFVDTTIPLLAPKSVGEVMIYTPKMLRRRISEQQISDDPQSVRTAVVAERLDAVFSPAKKTDPPRPPDETR